MGMILEMIGSRNMLGPSQQPQYVQEMGKISLDKTRPNRSQNSSRAPQKIRQSRANRRVLKISSTAQSLSLRCAQQIIQNKSLMKPQVFQPKF